MKFKQLQDNVDHAERLVAERSEQTVAGMRQLRSAWRAGWTPWRIVLAGVAAGFITGRAEPMAAIDKFTRIGWMQILRTASALFAGIQAVVMRGAEEAFSDTAGSAPDTEMPATPDDAAPPTPQAPRPAEAATKIS